MDGRVVVDVLRQVLTAQNLASFSLVDCVQSLLGETIEVRGGVAGWEWVSGWVWAGGHCCALRCPAMLLATACCVMTRC